jgi:hypothetical protein
MFISGLKHIQHKYRFPGGSSFAQLLVPIPSLNLHKCWAVARLARFSIKMFVLVLAYMLICFMCRLILEAS